MRILAIVRDVTLIVCAVVLAATTLYFANEYREFRADMRALRTAFSAENRERIRERVGESAERLKDRVGDSADRFKERVRDRFGRDKDKQD